MTDIMLTWLLGWTKKGQKGPRIFFIQKHLHKAKMLVELLSYFFHNSNNLSLESGRVNILCTTFGIWAKCS